MSAPFTVRLPLELAYRRRVLFALDLLDGVTLARVTQGVKVEAQGLRGQPVVNATGLFVWLQEDLTRLRKLSIDPGLLPFQKVELAPGDVTVPLTRVELRPRVDYPFDAGVTGLLGTLIEGRVSVPEVPTPVADAEVSLRWLDLDGDWHDSPIASQTSAQSGDFAAILRPAPADKLPLLDSDGLLTVRLRARRAAGTRDSVDLKLLPGRVAQPSTLDPLIFAWDELQP